MKLPKYTHGYISQHGKPCFYLRRPGHKKVRLPGLPWSPEFMAAREAALKGGWIEQEVGAKRTVAGTVNAALISYYQTSAFKDGLAESSQKMRRAILERFREEHGDKRIALMHKGALQNILNKKSPAAAANWRKALRGLIDHAMSLDMLTTDSAGRRQADTGQVKRSPHLGAGGVRPIRGTPCFGNTRATGLRVALAGRTFPLRHRSNGSPARPQRCVVVTTAENQGHIRRDGDADAASRHRRHATE